MVPFLLIFLAISSILCGRIEYTGVSSQDFTAIPGEGIYSPAELKSNSPATADITVKYHPFSAPHETLEKDIEIGLLNVYGVKLVGYGLDTFCCTMSYKESGQCDMVGSVVVPKNDSNLHHIKEFVELNETIHIQFNITESDYYFIYVSDCHNIVEPSDISVVVELKNPYGYLPGHVYKGWTFKQICFYIFISIVLIWLIVYIKYWSELLTVHHWILIILLLTLFEQQFGLQYYTNFNRTNKQFSYLFYISLSFEVLRKTTSRLLLLVVTLGYGLTKQTLGSTMNYIKLIGIIYAGLAFSEGIIHYKVSSDNSTKLMFDMLLAIVDAIFYLWIAQSITTSMIDLNNRQQITKLKIFSKLYYILIISLFISIVFYGLYVFLSIYDYEFIYWRNYWFFENGFWDLMYYVIFIGIIWLWRPTEHSTAYVLHEEVPSSIKDAEEY